MAKKTTKQEKPAFKISKRGDGRYEVTKRGGGKVNGLDKTKILIDAGLIKTKLPKPKTEEAAPAT